MRASPLQIALWILRRRRRFRIVGASMRPTFADGADVLVDPRAYRSAAPRPGHVILASHPTVADTLIVKRVAHLEADGRAFLVGDNEAVGASTDSRHFGAVSIDRVRGRVVGALPG